MSTLPVCLLLAFAAAAHAQQPALLLIEQAQMTDAAGYAIPGDGHEWIPVALPHAWYRDAEQTPRVRWYRVPFELAQAPTRTQRLVLARSNVWNMHIFVNGELLWRHTDAAALGSAIQPVVIFVPPRDLRIGKNLIHLRVEGSGRAFHGVPRLRIGDSWELSRMAGMRSFLQGQMITITAFAFGLAGILALAMWIAHRPDGVLFWYGVSGAGLLAVTLAWQLTLWTPEFSAERNVLVFLRFSGFLTPLFILHLRLVGRRHPWLEAALWLLLVTACASIAPQHARSAETWFWATLLFSLLPLLFLALLLADRSRRRTLGVWLLALADIAAFAFNLHDMTVRTGWLDFERLYLAYFVVPFILLAAGAEVTRRHLDGVRALRLTKVDLENRVRLKTREIEANYEREREVERERALLAERARIMADLHDGLGSRLVGLLSLAQSGTTSSSELTEGIAGALGELRLAVDALEPVEGDLGVILGNVRHRMRSVFERAGVQFKWNVDELPSMQGLTPSRVLAIQRILLEVFTNAIKHAAAAEIAVNARRTSEAVEVSIEDDGRGFDADAANNGHGLANLQLRAAQAGARLVVESGQTRGTRVVLTLPIPAGASIAPPPTGRLV